MKTFLKVRMSEHDAHYAGGLVDGARILQLIGDVATELLIRFDGDEGLFRAYDSVEFLNPVYAGDFLEVHGEIVSAGNTSRKMRFEVYKIITNSRIPGHESACDVLNPPILVAKASGTCVVPKERQRVVKKDG
ncbi:MULTISPECIES: 3-aminobutyryl-CoA ammonia lyase [Pseudothermotoga]|jgi:3-aminobutyryl-CoA ammonia-lyase|uniref:Thioesterase superfamily protein n=1 Tax=Pseudothermotoga lettingae (strain ATCC BAA-301 / DSM 14385 / NBRC 107922 / TMO) TaxID=416591 RepID=A8F3R1_PSELT|nr:MULTISPECIES: hotdog domain-containing protein [Pseudothermotoga]ABV32795.1 thioesterase superfamily protein [Pseudothermotoga lettingae TMO]GLI48209.1 3-aminobutyryl-CoA ammonia lyase [Pseudothermotoga lettingae TMO]